MIFSPDILETIVHWTNKKIMEVRPNYKETSHTSYLGVVELKGNTFTGSLIYSTLFKCGNESVLHMFATDGTGREIFRFVMSQKRFLFLLQVLRFNNPDDRQERKKDNPAAAIEENFCTFVENCQLYYTPGTFLCVDGMLVPFRGRYAFRKFMPKKPAKYGLNVQCLTDKFPFFLQCMFIHK